jgi:hypothetical protein
MGTVSLDNTEADKVNMATATYYAAARALPTHTTSSSANGSSSDQFTERLKARYYFDSDEFLAGVGDPGETGGGATSSEYWFHWENPTPGVAQREAGKRPIVRKGPGKWSGIPAGGTD